MEIRKVGGQSPVASNKRTDKTKGASGFADAFDETLETSSAAAPNPTIQVPSIASIMGGLGDRRGRNRQQLMRANILLDELEKLRLGIVEQRISVDVLKHLENALTNYPVDQIEDESLKELMLDIETRVVVELAKLEKI